MEPFYTLWNTVWARNRTISLALQRDTDLLFCWWVSFEGAEWVSRSLQIRRMFVCHTSDVVGICFLEEILGFLSIKIWRWVLFVIKELLCKFLRIFFERFCLLLEIRCIFYFSILFSNDI